MVGLTGCLKRPQRLLQASKDFLEYAERKGVKIFYVTNRVAIAEEATRNNLKKLGLPLDTDRDVLLMKNENGWTSDKVSRRQLISKDYRDSIINRRSAR